jgi:hypothetical protein
LPDTVQALIAARLDSLAPEHKILLQGAAVFGKVSGRERWPPWAAPAKRRSGPVWPSSSARS